MEDNEKMFEIYYGGKTAEIFSTGKQHLWGIVLARGEGER